MEGINRDYLGKHKKFRVDSKKLATAFLLAAFIVAIIVFWWLKLVGITVTGEAFCGVEEHSHSADCYTSELVCGFNVALHETAQEETTQTEETTTEATTTEEDATEATTIEDTTSEESVSEATTEDADYVTAYVETYSVAHSHSNECYETVLVCTRTEHTHTPECYPDYSADVETVSDWLRTIENVEITNNISENLIAIAMSQVGYEESKNNFEFDADGNKNGYSRYGEWYGNPYGKWNTMFLSFCLHYSNINNVSELKNAGAEAMKLAWQKRNAYSSAEEYSPQR